MYTIDKLIEFEERNNLFDTEIKGVKFWHLVRFSIYQNYINSFVTDFKNTAVNTKKKTTPAIKVTGLETFFKMLTKSPIFIKKNTEVLIFNAPRRVKNGEHYICPYTDDYIKNLDKSYAIIELPYMGFHYYNTPKTNLYYSDMFSAILGIASRLKLLSYCSEDEKENIRNFTAKLTEEFSISESDEKKINLYIQHTIERHLFNYKLYHRLFKRINPKIILEFCSYRNLMFSVTKAARDLNIPTAELQHGVMGKFHVGYNYGNVLKLETFPDYLFLFGQAWKDSTRFPISKDKLILMGWPFFERRISESKIKRGEKFNILFFSQPYSGIEISKTALEMSKIMDTDKYEIVYKLHPKEYDSWKHDYPWLIDSNIEVIDNNLNDVYYYMAKANLQIGCNSTVLFEGLGFNLDTVILKISGYEYMEVLYGGGHAQLLDNALQIKEYIEQTKSSSAPKDYSYFWHKCDVKSINAEIDKIVK